MAHAGPGPAPKGGVSAAWWPWAFALAGLAALYLPTLYDLATTIWSTEEQAHGRIVAIVCAWLFWRQRQAFAVPASPGSDANADATRPGWGWAWLALALLLYLFGRSQRILSAQTLSAIPALVGALLLLRGPQAPRALWFPLFFMLFLVPLPAAMVDAVTQPMKLAVSSAAASLLYELGYPVARSGVILQVGPYQLLVADACAGLHTLFTLEAMGLLYLNVVRSSSVLRNVALALLIVPISFAANVIRVMALTLITYHLGDAAGQGFLHDFAGLALFLSALLLIVLSDTFLRWLSPAP